MAMARARIAAFLEDACKRRIAYAALAAVLAVLCMFPQPQVGRAKIVPQDPGSALAFGSGAGKLQDLAALFGGGRRAIDLYLAIGQSEDVRDEVIRNLKLVGSSGRYRTRKDASARLERRVEVQSLPGGVIEIEVTTHDADESLRLTKGYAEAIATRYKALNGEQLTTKRALVSTRFHDAATQLADAEAKLDAFRRRNGLSASPEAELGAALSVRTALEAQLKAKQVELGTLRQFLGPENANLIGVQSEVAELSRKLSQTALPEGNTGAPSTGELTRLSNEYANVYRDYIFAQSLYQIYTRISEEVTVEELSGRTASTVQVIEAPHLDPWRHYNVSALAALALLVLGAFFTEIYTPATGIALWRRQETTRP
jgi:hypothetical protein